MQMPFQTVTFRNPDGGGAVLPETSRQIIVARVLCIFFMMGVHVSPGFEAAAYGPSDAMHWIGALWVDVLGRSSVPALSIVSGFLMSVHAGRQGLTGVARDRFRTLVLPMLFWTAVLATLALAARELAGAETLTWQRFFGDGPVRLLTEHMLFLHGHPANVPLAFLRDLFVCCLIVAVLQARLGRWVVLALPISVVIWQTVGYGDLILRPAILSFVLAGVVLQRWRGDLTLPHGLRLAVRGAMVWVVAQHCLGWSAPFEAVVPQDMRLLVFRVVVSAFALDMALVLSRGPVLAWLRPWEPVVYLAYLSHGVVISCLWQGVEPLVGGPTGAAYPVFFLVAPVVALVTARVLAQGLDHAPSWLQIAVSGKAVPGRRPRLHPDSRLSQAA